MKKLFPHVSSTKAAPVLGLALVVLLVSSPVVAEDLEDLLVQVSEDYALAYASPFIEAFGPNQNSALYQDAYIPWGGLNFGIGIKVMASHLNESDQTFQKNVRVDDLGAIDPSVSGPGTAIFAGPTIFGDTNTNGTITLLPDSGAPVALEGIPGLVESRFVPLVAPEVFVGGVFGLKGTLRWFPEMGMGDYGKSKYLGYGLQWSPSDLLATLPVDLSVGFFKQEIKVGSLIETSASSLFLAASKDLGAVTVYGGFAKEDADMTVTYVYEDTGENVSFEATARQESRFTVGARLGFFNAEMAHGDLTTYSGGLMLGF